LEQLLFCQEPSKISNFSSSFTDSKSSSTRSRRSNASSYTHHPTIESHLDTGNSASSWSK
jgi:hypothetical protein